MGAHDNAPDRSSGQGVVNDQVPEFRITDVDAARALATAGYYCPKAAAILLIRDNYFCRVATITFAGLGRPDGVW